MAYLTRDGVRIYYEHHGQGPAVLLTHGYGATSHMWAGQIENFKERYHMIVWDMRGHGQTDYPEDQAAYSEAHTVADMAAVLDACGEETAVIGGHSLGGYFTLAFNVAHPGQARALMLIDTGPGFKNPKAQDAWNERTIKRAESLETQGLAALGGSDEVQSTRHRSADGLAKAARGMLTRQDSRAIESLPGISLPTLVLVGADDERFIAPTDYMAAKIPGASKVVIADAGHGPNINQPEAFNRAMGEFLAGLPAA
jgi:pimeloyl-ACP methyl ester carboxylesterase